MVSFASAASRSLETSPDLQHELTSAVSLGSLERVRSCLERGANPAISVDENSPSAFHYATEIGNIDVVNSLLEQNLHTFNKKSELRVLFNPQGRTVFQVARTQRMANFWATQCPALLQAPSRDGSTPLMTAVEDENENKVRLLLEGPVIGMFRRPLAKAAVNAVNAKGFSALHLACAQNHRTITHLLLSSKADPVMQTQDRIRHTALGLACDRGAYSAVSALTEHIRSTRNPEKVFSKIFMARGPNPLLCACRHGHGMVVAHLFNNVHLHLLQPHVHESLLEACKAGHDDVSCVKLLVKRSIISLDCSDEQEQTPLHLACSSGSLEIVKWLWKTMSSKRGFRSLEEPCKKMLAKEMEQQHPVWTRMTRMHRTPLMLAAENDHVDVCRFIVQEASPSFFTTDFVNAQHETALSLACYAGSHRSALLFAYHGARMHLSTKHSHHNCVDIAQECGHGQLADALQCCLAQNLWNLMHYINEEAPHIWMKRKVQQAEIGLR